MLTALRNTIKWTIMVVEPKLEISSGTIVVLTFCFSGYCSFVYYIFLDAKKEMLRTILWNGKLQRTQNLTLGTLESVTSAIQKKYLFCYIRTAPPCLIRETSCSTNAATNLNLCSENMTPRSRKKAEGPHSPQSLVNQQKLLVEPRKAKSQQWNPGDHHGWAINCRRWIILQVLRKAETHRSPYRTQTAALVIPIWYRSYLMKITYLDYFDYKFLVFYNLI